VSAQSISGNTIVGAYVDAKNRTHGFVYNGTTWTTLDDPLFSVAGITALYGIDGSKIVGNTQSSGVAAAFLYDGGSFTRPFGIEGQLGGNFHQFFDISGNRIVGTYQDRPFVYIIPEPATFLLAALGLLALFPLATRKRSRASPRRFSPLPRSFFGFASQPPPSIKVRWMLSLASPRAQFGERAL
ncbi:MAG: PEP-CTERM sorting domain-containing protein, partial [Pirellulales bacterium]|nr:PEP-CTERM sorting domain-containing protein [Pirellulales bacterium]